MMNHSTTTVSWILKTQTQKLLLILPETEANLDAKQAGALAASLVQGAFQISALSVGTATIDYNHTEKPNDTGFPTIFEVSGKSRSAFKVTLSDGREKIAVVAPGFTPEEIVEMVERDRFTVTNVQMLEYAIYPIRLTGNDQIYQHDGRHLNLLGVSPVPTQFGCRVANSSPLTPTMSNRS